MKVFFFVGKLKQALRMAIMYLYNLPDHSKAAWKSSEFSVCELDEQT